MVKLGLGMDEFQFPVRYGGGAVDVGRMDVRDLGPSLVGLGAACQRVSEHLYGPDARLRVEITSQPHKGAFVVDLALAVASSGVLLCPPSAARDVFDKLRGVIEIIKKFGGRKEKPSIRQEAGGIVVIGDGNTVIRTGKTEINLVLDPTVTAGVADLSRPLLRAGIDEIGLGEGEYAETLSREDGPALVSEEPVIEPPGVTHETEERTAVVRFVQIRLDGNERSWRVCDKDQVYSVHVEDHEFLRDVRSGKQPLTERTALRVNMRTSWDFYPDYRAQNVQRVITKVVEILPPKNTLSILPEE